MHAAPRRVGILGGTFNPIHQGHIQMAQDVRLALGLDTVLLIPAADPPHKEVDGHVSAEHRYKMVCLAAEGLSGVSVSDIEIARGGKSYTVDTVTELKRRFPQDGFYVIVGSDLLNDIPAWSRAEELMRLVTIVGVKRQGQDSGDEEAAERFRSEYGARIETLNIAVPPVSSTMVRDRVYDALPINGLVPPAVETYICEEGLYLPAPLKRMQEDCRAALNRNRYRHTMGVVRTAIALADRYGADAEKARLAALLHDCARGSDSGALSHAASGERLARTRYGVTDEEVLRAIRLHTTSGQGATKLDKIIYVADMIEPGREFPGVERLRALAFLDLNAAMLECLKDCIGYVRARGQSVDERSLAALKELEDNQHSL
ncbi:MAG TPA: nicotinate-nucleotide adenylyltransferase [Feifaniaceae bacterium]|nr:nicotinate-nucleotide adenylyltransferase [Feifaniaceae bacterium]